MTVQKKKKSVIFWFIAAILCVLYGIAVFLTGSGTAFFLIWIALGIASAFLAFAAKHSLWKKLPRFWRIAIIAVLCAALLVFLFVEALIFGHFFDKGESGLDYIVVLGAQVYSSGPSPVLKFRLDAALDYLRANPDTVCIVTGGQGYNEPFPEAVGMADYLVRAGIDAERIILEPESQNTAQNIENSMNFIEPGKTVGIVTNNFHVYRAVTTAEKAGLTDVCGIAAGASLTYLPNNLLREFFGVIKYALT